jgi:uncharacterized protein (TIGR02598 family)
MFLRTYSPVLGCRTTSPLSAKIFGQLDPAMKAQIAQFQRKNCAGFNLVEIAMALAIISFSCTCLLGLLPASLTAFHQAMGNTIESQIVQSLSNDLELDAFSTLSSNTFPTTYYYDSEGQSLPTSTGAYYTAKVAFGQVTTSNSPVNLSGATTGTVTSVAVYNVSVSVTDVGLANPHIYTFIIANNGL